MDEYKSLKRQIIINRILLLILIGLVLIFMAVFGFVCIKTYLYFLELKPFFDTLAAIDFGKINEMLGTLEAIKGIDIESITQTFNSIDFEKIMELINSINIEEIEKAMEGLSNASKLLEEVTEKVSPILNLFSR